MTFGSILAAAGPLLTIKAWLSVSTFTTFFGATTSLMEKKYCQAGFRLIIGGFLIRHLYSKTTASPTAKEPTVGEILNDLPDDTMIHLTPSKPSSFESGVKPYSFWARLGDVRNMTVREYQAKVVGPGAEGSKPEAHLFIATPDKGKVFYFWQRSFFYELNEYVNEEPIVVSVLKFFEF